MTIILTVRNRKSAAAVLAVIAIAAVMVLASGDWERAEAQSPGGDVSLYENMDPLLQEIIAQQSLGVLMRGESADASAGGGGSVGVVLLTDAGASEDVREYLLENGAFAGQSFDGFVGAEVPVGLLASVSEQDGVVWMQAMIPPRVVESEASSPSADEHGADVWHAAGLTGEGVKIGIIHHGFEGFEKSIEGGTLPGNDRLEVRCYTYYGLYTTDIGDCVGHRPIEVGYGTVAAEATYGFAPDATYYIANVHSQIGLLAAVRWMVENEVDVIESSLVWTWSGPGDGTSPLPISELNIVDDAVDGGALWVSPASNDARATWFGGFQDSDSDGVHNFKGDDDCNRVEIEPGDFFMGMLRWEGEWVSDVGSDDEDEKTELDLYLLDEKTSKVVRQSYRRWWDRDGTAPMKYIYFSSYQAVEGAYCLRVELSGGEVPEWIQLQAFYGEKLEHYTSEGSIGSPAESANPGLLSVGTASLEDPNVIWEDSSQGPAPDGRLKPELVGGQHEGDARIHGIDDRDYMPGTGHEAAEVAGIAALVKQRFPEFGPVEIAEYLKTHAEDRGVPGPDNTWGYGYVTLPDADVETPADGVCFIRIEGDADVTGSWDEDCVSPHVTRHGIAEGRYARFYTFTLDVTSDVMITLSSQNQDIYMYLMEGALKNGEVIEENDDDFTGEGYNSRIAVSSLKPGDYTIEATTYYAERKGDFRLVVDVEASAAE